MRHPGLTMTTPLCIKDISLGHGNYSPILSSYGWITPSSKVEPEFIEVEHKTGHQVAPAGSQWWFTCILHTFFCKYQRPVTSSNTLVQTCPPNSIVVWVLFNCTPELGTEAFPGVCSVHCRVAMSSCHLIREYVKFVLKCS